MASPGGSSSGGVPATTAGSRIRRATFSASPITRSSFCKSSGLSR